MPAGVFKSQRNLPSVISGRREAAVRIRRAIIPAIDEVKVEIVPDAAFQGLARKNNAPSGPLAPAKKAMSWRALKQWRRSLELLRGEGQ